MLLGGSRISHLRESSRRYHYRHHYQHHHRPRHHINNYCATYQHHQSLKLGIGKTKFIKLTSSLMLLRLSPFTVIGDNLHRQQLQHRTMSPSCSLHSKSPGEIPVLSNCFSQQEEYHSLPDDRSCSLSGGVVALGKFDALHIGHRELAIQASKIGSPYLLSFVGMAEVLGWEPKPPIVAKCDRSRVLSLWAAYCGNVIPREYQIEFSSVRRLSPREFVEKLSKELGVRGVVAGENYRFGYKAAGDASELIRLCEEYGIGAYIINSVMDRSQNLRNMALGDAKDRGQVSSTRVRHALGVGDMKYVSELLGRQHRLMLTIKDENRLKSAKTRWKVSAPRSCLLNLPPKDGIYENCSLLVGNDNEKRVACKVYIDSEDIHLEMDDIDFCNHNSTQGFQRLGIEFGE